MFENLDQSKGQSLTGQTPPAAPAAIRPPQPPMGNMPSMPKAPAVEDMFASVKDIGPTAKINNALNKNGQPAAASSGKSGGGWRALLVIVIILVIIGLGIFIAGKFLGVELLSPSSWSDKISSLTSSLLNKPGQTVVINNETPAPANNVTPPASTTVTPPVTPATTSPVNPIVATSSAPAVATSTAKAVTPPAGTVVDTDGDGLPDLAEAAVGSNPLKVDTDGDGYSDKTEVDSLYNPVGSGVISADPFIAEYQNTKQDYSVLYPKSFTVQDVVNNDGSVIVFSVPANFSIQVSVQPNALKEDILTWYNKQFANAPATAGEVVVQNGLSGIYSPDKNNYFLTNAAKTKLFTVTYNSTINQNDKTYYDIFLVIAKSLKEISQ